MLAGTTNLRRLDQVEHFWDTVDTIGEGFGFSLFGARHLVTLALYIGFAALSCKLYKAADEKKRAQLRGLFAVLLLADEAFKQIGLQIGGDIRPSVRYMGKCFLLLLAMAVPIYCVNLLLDTNFMFLMYAPDGNPLAWFRDHVGYHWIGFPVLLVAVFALMDVPIMLKKRKEDKLLSAVK